MAFHPAAQSLLVPSFYIFFFPNLFFQVMGLSTHTENKCIGARNASFSFSCFTAQRLLVINSFMMFVQHRDRSCFASTFLLGDGWLLSLLAQNWISQKIKQNDRRSVFHAWALQGGKAGSRNYISRFPWDTAAPCAREEIGPSLLSHAQGGKQSDG